MEQVIGQVLKKHPLCYFQLLFFSATSVESLQVQRWSQVEKTHGCAWTKENIYPALLLPHVEIICLAYDLRDTKDISSGHISLDWQCEFCRTSDWQR